MCRGTGACSLMRRGTVARIEILLLVVSSTDAKARIEVKDQT